MFRYNQTVKQTSVLKVHLSALNFVRHYQNNDQNYYRGRYQQQVPPNRIPNQYQKNYQPNTPYTNRSTYQQYEQVEPPPVAATSATPATPARAVAAPPPPRPVPLQQQRGQYSDAASNGQFQPMIRNGYDNRAYIDKTIGIRFPQTRDDAISLLMNWNFVALNKWFLILRESIVKYNSLTDKQMQTLQNIMLSNKINKSLSPFFSYFEMDPIDRKLLQITEDDIKIIEQNKDKLKNKGSIKHDKLGHIVSDMQRRYLETGKLTPKQRHFLGFIFMNAFGDKFNVNGNFKKDDFNKQSK